MPACWKRPNISWNSAGDSIRCPWMARAWFRPMPSNRCWPPQPASLREARPAGRRAAPGQRDAGQPRDGRVATDRATGGPMPFGRSAFAYRCGRGGRQDADRLPRAGRDRLEHRRTQVPGPAGHRRADSPSRCNLAPMLLAAISKRACGRARSRSPWPSACKPPWNFGKGTRRALPQADRTPRSFRIGTEGRAAGRDRP